MILPLTFFFSIILCLFLNCSASNNIRPSSKNSVKVNTKTSKSIQKQHKSEGVASYYGRKFHGRTTASGEPYNMYAMTAAHNTFPFNTKIKVTNLENGKSVIVRINDRGPSIKGRIIDLSYKAAKRIDMIEKGTVQVVLELVKE